MVVSSSILFVGTDLQIVYGQYQCMFVHYLKNLEFHRNECI